MSSLRQKYGKDRVGVTAATGIAATHIGGTTLHAFCRCGILNTVGDFQKMYARDNKKRLGKVRAIVLDECSMVSAEFFEYLERTFRAMRSSSRPFGGVQIVLSGDFYQLPPIPNRAPQVRGPPAKGGGPRAAAGGKDKPFLNRGLLFQAPAFRKCDFVCTLLTKVFRQEEI